MARTLVADLEARDSNRRAEFIIAPQVTATGDAALLRIVLVNLFENAWKFTRRKETARIEFGMANDAGTAAYFLRDNGAGFDPAYLQKLFRPFERLHPNAEFEGTGIGLATVERIVKRHGGRIWAEGAPELGATFYFTLQTRGTT